MKKAPINKRLFAYVIDWYLGWIFAVIPIAIASNIFGINQMSFDLTSFKKPEVYIVGAISLLYCVIYFYVIPLLNQGKTVGKKIMRLRIVKDNGEKLESSKLAMRQILGVMILENSLIISGKNINELISVSINSDVARVLSSVTFVIFVISCFLILKTGKAIHDLFAHSIVIED